MTTWTLSQHSPNIWSSASKASSMCATTRYRSRLAGVMFLMTVNSIEALLKALPPGQANLLTFEVMPIGPLAPLGMLIK